MCPRITRARSRGPLKNSLLVQRGCTQRIPPEEKETCRGKGFEGEREGGKKRHYANARFRNARAEWKGSFNAFIENFPDMTRLINKSSSDTFVIYASLSEKDLSDRPLLVSVSY